MLWDKVNIRTAVGLASTLLKFLSTNIFRWACNPTPLPQWLRPWNQLTCFYIMTILYNLYNPHFMLLVSFYNLCPANNYIFKFNNRNTRTKYEICSGVVIVNFKHFTPCSSVSVVNFEQVNAGWRKHQN